MHTEKKQISRTHFRNLYGAQHSGLASKVLALDAQGFRKGACSYPGSPASHPDPCLWPGKAVEDGPKPWDPAPLWDTRKKLLDPDFGWA